MANITYLTETDTNKVTELLNDTLDNASYFEETSTNVLRAYSSDLDGIMTDLYSAVTQPDKISDEALERYYAELTNLLYFMGDKLEKLSILSDMSKASAKEVYNKTYLISSEEKDDKGKSKKTVAENTAAAENSAVYETAVGAIYEHAYKALKYKIDGGYEMVNSIRKIISKRMSEQQLSFGQPKSQVATNIED